MCAFRPEYRAPGRPGHTFPACRRFHGASTRRILHKSHFKTPSEARWSAAAVEKQGVDLWARDGFSDTHWYKFHHAAKAYPAFVADMLKEY